MKRQKNNEYGITLVALVVSIIVMLVLAGVSLNATIGENGIVTRAQEATLQHKIATELENLNLELAKANIEVIADDEDVAIEGLVNDLIDKNVIDSYVENADGNMAVGIDRTTRNKYFFLVKGDNTYKVTQENDGLFKAELSSMVSGGDISGGYALITESSFNNDNSLPETEKGKFTIVNDANVVFMDTVSGALSIYVKSGVHANVEIYAKMDLTNANIQRSAIELESGATLDLYVDRGVEVNVNSGVATVALEGVPGKGGYAGIRVPEGATLNLDGEGTIIARGGNGSAGSDVAWTRNDPNWQRKVGAGGGGAGAGIGGKGGNGGTGGVPTVGNGGNGEKAGNINIHNSIKVYAYGGGGGKAGDVKSGANASSSGAGGYPAAGIGGGGAGGGGGTCCSGSGGYTSGVDGSGVNGGINGLCATAGYYGGAYYQGYQGYTAYGIDDNILGGLGAMGSYSSAMRPANDYQVHDGGNGGKGGEGATIKKSVSSLVKAYNGNIFTDGTAYSDGDNQAYIYAQNGVATKKVIFPKTMKPDHTATLPTYIDAHDIDTLEKYDSGLTSKSYTLSSSLSDFTFDMSKQGIGSGAGYIETSNGSYEIYNEDSTGNFTTVYTGV